MKDIIIVEYDKKYAAGIADMWNGSGENWGGYNTLKTAEAVEQEEENATNLNLYLALDGDKVVGYCSFSLYSLDVNTTYIPLLNVLPEYHNRKVGKALVKRVVERAIEYGLPRLDLFTWPGNIKAVPLYKKCGFFWERRDDSVHCMNFLPKILNTELLKDKFSYFDWYGDNLRAIDVEPDGKISGNFEFYEYLWEKENRYLRTLFERKGRRLVLIETEEYLIRLHTEEQKRVFGREYPVFLEISNHKQTPLTIEVSGKKGEILSLKMDHKTTVPGGGNIVIEGSFHVGSIEIEQDDLFRTVPGMNLSVRVDGKSAEMGTGIIPKFPVGMEINETSAPARAGETSPPYPRSGQQFL
jgi:ribosomal protein S18 acetylase RimI-like enzyme